MDKVTMVKTGAAVVGAVAVFSLVAVHPVQTFILVFAGVVYHFAPKYM